MLFDMKNLILQQTWLGKSYGKMAGKLPKKYMLSEIREKATWAGLRRLQKRWGLIWTSESEST